LTLSFSLSRAFDPTEGGFGKAPKFPRPSVFDFLIRYHFYQKNPRALESVLFTLKKMGDGGIYDHIGRNIFYHFIIFIKYEK
jgi:uncharacterized protein YyaL (SSP411 family)